MLRTCELCFGHDQITPTQVGWFGICDKKVDGGMASTK